MSYEHANETFEDRMVLKLPRGVSFYPRTGRYRAQIQLDGVKRTLGYFDTPEAASQAYELAKEKEVDRGLFNVETVRGFLEQNLGCKKKEVVAATGLHPRTIARAIKIIRGQI